MRRSLLLVSLLVVSSLSGQAALKLGTVRYEFGPNMATLTLGTNLIKNTSQEDATGSIKLQLWACTAPYTGGTIQGSLLGSTGTINGLGPGQYYENLSRSMPYVPPKAAGTYHLVFVLLEYRAGNYVIVNHVNMTNPKALAPLPLFTMRGPSRWKSSYEGGTVEIDVGKISHRRTGNSGTLKLSVWATSAPYRGGALSGYEIGAVRKEALKPGFTYDNVKNVAKFVPPPNGTYYVSIVLSEWADGAYRVVAHLPFDAPAKFVAPVKPAS